MSKASWVSCLTSENKQDWDSHLPIPMMAYYSVVYETTSFTPCELMFRCQIDLSIELQLGQLKPQSGDENKTQYVQHLQARLDRVHDVRERKAQAVLGSQGTDIVASSVGTPFGSTILGTRKTGTRSCRGTVRGHT